MRRLVPWSVLSCILGLSLASEAAPPKKERRDEKMRLAPEVDMLMLDSSLAPPAPSMGATPGGAQDIGHFRDRVAAGEIPLPQTFTPEGLFSEHDLPVTNHAGCKQTFCAEAEAMQVSLIGQSDVEVSVQRVA